MSALELAQSTDTGEPPSTAKEDHWAFVGSRYLAPDAKWHCIFLAASREPLSLTTLNAMSVQEKALVAKARIQGLCATEFEWSDGTKVVDIHPIDRPFANYLGIVNTFRRARRYRSTSRKIVWLCRAGVA